MLGFYLRLVLFLAGLVGAVILFAFAFTAAAVVVVVGLLLFALLGKKPQVQWTVVRPGDFGGRRDEGVVIDHDPNDLRQDGVRPPGAADDDPPRIPRPPQ